jgi:hypothetical protein
VEGIGRRFYSGEWVDEKGYVRCSIVLDLKTILLKGEGTAGANGQREGLCFCRTRRVHVTCGVSG